MFTWHWWFYGLSVIISLKFINHNLCLVYFALIKRNLNYLFSFCFPHMHLCWIFSMSHKLIESDTNRLALIKQQQKSAKTDSLDQCAQLVLIKVVCTGQAKTAHKCLLCSYPVGLNVSKPNGWDLTNKASCVWKKLMLEWSKKLGKEDLSAFIFLSLQCIFDWRWREKFRQSGPNLEFVILYWNTCFSFAIFKSSLWT